VNRSDRRPDELRGLVQLASDEFGDATGGIEQVHRAVADRVFRHVGPIGAPVRAGHDAIAGGVYAAIRAGSDVVARTAGMALRARRVEDARVLSTSRRGSLVLGALQGLRGDALERAGSDLREPVSVRVHVRPVRPTPDALSAAFPRATPRVVVFLHGLMQTELAWRHGSEAGEDYGSRLDHDLGWTPVYVRYNSGRHVSENGASVADLLEQVCEGWPVDVADVALVGHSMGGLVARSACHVASLRGQRWAHRVRHVISLGSPHTGAPLERAVHLADAALAALPETRPFAGLLRRRSAGIRDLRRGSLVDEDWRGRDVDALRAAACAEVPPLDCATYSFVAATMTRSAGHPLGRLLGDGLVLVPSASGRDRTRRFAFTAGHGLHVGGATHFALLDHPAVYEQLREWLARPPQQDDAGAAG
jgi:pimeloyl-ACP methyl ester carboxylesterase